MLPHILRLAWRHIRNHRLYTLIHVVGLSIGICACVVIWLIVHYDLSFDRFHPDSHRIYRIIGDQNMPDGRKMYMNAPSAGLAPLEHALPGVETEAIFHYLMERITIPAYGDHPPMTFDGKQPDSYNGVAILTNAGFFDLFPHRWLIGSPAVLDQPGRVVLAESSARKYFGAGPLNQMLNRKIIYSDSINVTVAGIVADWDQPSDLGYTDFLSLTTPRDGNPAFADWRSVSPDHSQVFIRLDQATNPERINAIIKNYFATHPPKLFPGASGLRYFLQPLTAMHFTPDMHQPEDGDPFRKAYKPLLYTLMGIAVFILLLAMINFINLSTALSLERVKEVGIRKVLGSSRLGLVTQFLFETSLYVITAVVISCCLTQPVLNLFSQYIPTGVTYAVSDKANILFLLIIIIAATLMAGGYPALVSSAPQPASSLKGGATNKQPGATSLRRSLIVFQFTISLLFIIGSGIIGSQIKYMRDSNKGFDSDDVVVVRGGPSVDAEKIKVVAEAIKPLPGISAVIEQATAPMGFQHIRATTIYRNSAEDHGSFENRGAGIDTIAGYWQFGNADFIPFYKMRLLAGQNFAPGDSTRQVVVNESYVHAMDLQSPHEAIGKLIQDRSMSYTITGVVADFHTESFHETILPTVIRNASGQEGQLAIRLASHGQQAGDVKKTLTQIEAKWNQLVPETPIQYDFLNETITRLYDQETHSDWLMQIAVLISVMISGMGLFGLALFTTQRRAKEIGIRKVLGATVQQLIALLTKDFVYLVLLALAIATPIAWYWGTSWLNDFAYRTPVSPWTIAEAGLGAITLTIITVGVHVLKIARAKPAETLRSE